MWRRVRRMVGICFFFLVSCVAQAEWYEVLRPGVTRSEIIAVAGPPTTVSEGDDLYYLEQGFLVLSYSGDSLQECLHNFPGEGALYSNLYGLKDGPLTQEHIEERMAYIEEGQFIFMPKFNGPHIYTALHPGCKCYRLGDGYITVSNFGTYGYFAHHAEEIVRYTNADDREVLYRADEHWSELKPDYLTDAQLAKREAAVKQLETSFKLPQSPEKMFGEPDDSMGSGIVQILYYSRDGFISIWGGHMVVFDELKYAKYRSERINDPEEAEPFSRLSSDGTVSEETLNVVPNMSIDFSEVEKEAVELQEKRKKAQEQKAEEQKKSLAAAKEKSRKQSLLSASRKRDYLKYCEDNKIAFSESGKRPREECFVKSSCRTEDQKNKTFYYFETDKDGTILCGHIYYINY